MTDGELISMAISARELSYAPYSQSLVGAALECKDGRVFTGCNIENSCYGASLSAETVALAKAVSCGHHEFVRIAIVSDNTEYCYPTGICRQILAEFSPNIECLCAKSNGRYESYMLSKLLPCQYRIPKKIK